jgi:D-alanyl-D-alanine carboxypeptidase/D-alanyl-D-alanine-endopeptidase (penicillin-binding protein 4)
MRSRMKTATKRRKSAFRGACVLAAITCWLTSAARAPSAAQSAPQVAPHSVPPARLQHGARRAGKGSRPKQVPRERFAARADALTQAGAAEKGEWGILIADAETGETLFERNSDKYFVPASNMKLFSTALALATLGPDYRFHTTLESRGTVAPDGALSGDLVLVGRGDPNLSNRKFPFDLKEEFDGPPERVIAELADALVAKGVKSISGDVIGNDSYFPRERYPSGWEIDDMVWQYGAAVSAIVVDDNTVTLTLTAGQAPGEPVQAELAPFTADFLVENRVGTSESGAKSDLSLTREPAGQTVILEGTLPAKSQPRKLVLAVQEPALHAAAILKRLLEQRGVSVSGVARAEHQRPLSAVEPVVLADHISVPLSDSIKLVNKISQNLHTEVLLRNAAREACLRALPGATALACFDLKADAIFTQFCNPLYATMGIPPDDVMQTDGSGLSRRDLVTPRSIVALLQYVRKQPWFAPYYASLPVAGVDGTLEDRLKNSDAAGRIHAKTGSLEHVRTRSGYGETPNGRKLIFSFLGNNQGGKNHEAIDVLDGLSLAMIEEFDQRSPGCCKK